MQTAIERHRLTVLNRPPLGAFLARWKRRKRQGWEVTLLNALESGDVIAFGYRLDDAEPEPDRTGQYELNVD